MSRPACDLCSEQGPFWSKYMILYQTICKRTSDTLIRLQIRLCGCAPSEDSDQTAHLRSLIRIFTVCIWIAKDASFFMWTVKTLITLCRCAVILIFIWLIWKKVPFVMLWLIWHKCHFLMFEWIWWRICWQTVKTLIWVCRSSQTMALMLLCDPEMNSYQHSSR